VTDRATITFYQGDDEETIEMAVDLPESFDPDNVRKFEIAALAVIEFFRDNADDFERLSTH